MYGSAFSSSHDRAAIQYAALQVFLHQHDYLIEQQLRARYSDAKVNTYAPFINPTRNPLQRCAELQAVMYQRSPRLSSPDNQQAALDIIDYTPDLYQTLAYAQRMAYAVGDVFMVPYWDENHERVMLDLLPPHTAEVKMDRSALRSISFKKYDNENTRTWYAWDADFKGPAFDTRDPRGRMVEARKPVMLDGGVLPVVWISVNPVRSISLWATGDILDLVNGTIQIGELETFHDFTNITKSYKQMYLKGEGIADADTGEAIQAMQVDAGPETILEGELGATELNDPNDPFLSTIQRIEADLAATRGISSVTYRNEYRSMESYKFTTEELRQRWRKQVKVFAPYEKQLYRIILALLNSRAGKNYDIDTRFSVDYFKPEELDDYTTALADFKMEVELGLNSVSKFIYKYNPELRTREEAAAEALSNYEERAKWAELMAERNMPKDPTDPANDPTVNGAMGQGASGPNNPRSLEYQQQDNDARSSELNNAGMQDTGE